MAARAKHRDSIVRAAVTLFRRHGYSGTGLNDIVALSGAPKGSLYHYFPDGKLSIAEAAVTAAGQNLIATLEALGKNHKTAGSLVRAFAVQLAAWMAKSKFRDGAPMTTVLLETAPDDPKVTAAGRAAFEKWRGLLADRLVARGAAPVRAARLAALAVAALEGSLIQARVERSADIIVATGEELEQLLDEAVPAPTAMRKSKRS